MGIMQQEREAESSPPPSAEVKNEEAISYLYSIIPLHCIELN
jgi:hypothetical protein